MNVLLAHTFLEGREMGRKSFQTRMPGIYLFIRSTMMFCVESGYGRGYRIQRNNSLRTKYLLIYIPIFVIYSSMRWPFDSTVGQCVISV